MKTLKSILMVLIMGMLSSCVSGIPPREEYLSSSGKSTVLENNKEMCLRSCNDEYSRCMETHAASGNSGIIGPSGVFGASADCKATLKHCLQRCR